MTERGVVARDSEGALWQPCLSDFSARGKHEVASETKRRPRNDFVGGEEKQAMDLSLSLNEGVIGETFAKRENDPWNERQSKLQPRR